LIYFFIYNNLNKFRLKKRYKNKIKNFLLAILPLPASYNVETYTHF